VHEVPSDLLSERYIEDGYLVVEGHSGTCLSLNSTLNSCAQYRSLGLWMLTAVCDFLSHQNTALFS